MENELLLSTISFRLAEIGCGVMDLQVALISSGKSDVVEFKRRSTKALICRGDAETLLVAVLIVN